MLISTLSFWFGDFSNDDIKYELYNYILLADAYKWTIPKSKQGEVLLSFASAMIATMIYE
jgi:hypothetical protein